MRKSLCTVGIALLLTTLAPAALVGCADDAGQSSANATEVQRLGQFEVFEGVDDQFYFRLVANNGEIVLASEGYTRRSSAEAGIASVKAHGIDRENYRLLENQAGDYYFNLVARNNQVIGTSEAYASLSNAERGADTVQGIVASLVDTPVDDEVRVAIEKGAEGALLGAVHGSESDYPFTYVEAELSPGEEVTMDLIREKFAAEVDNDPDADKPLAELYGMVGSDWRTTAEICHDAEDAEYNGYTEDCAALMELDHALEANLTDIQAFYFGRVGGPDYVDGVAVSILIVGRTPGGKLAGVRTITIWT
jgi:uncharacterized protein YegP (UPF0339 family)